MADNQDAWVSSSQSERPVLNTALQETFAGKIVRKGRQHFFGQKGNQQTLTTVFYHGVVM